MTTPIPMPRTADADPLGYPLLAQLMSRHDFTALEAGTFDTFCERAGRTLLVFTEDPVRYRETLDLAVIVPELARAFAGRFAVGVLLPKDARREAVRYGFRRWPAVVMLADGRYVGAIDGLRSWAEYVAEIDTLLASAPSRPPSVGIAVSGGTPAAGDCHA